ncbi:MAG: nitroreductase family protein [Candidatus Omnitrophica bacterium]|nr:nitroreductase family protein [Candidatus Omnitrophota bacterium]
MDLFTAIAKRHSYRGLFSERPVLRMDLQKIVQAGLLAPSAKNAQTTQFVIIDDPNLVQRIGQMHTMDAMRTAKAFIAAIIDEQPEAVCDGNSFQIEDCTAALENTFLAVTALGYATVWLDNWLRTNGRAETIGSWIRVPPGKIIRVIMPIGVPAEERQQREKKPFHERAWFNQYGQNS